MKSMEILFLIGRIFFGALFILNGIDHLLHNTKMALYAQSKNVPMPRIAVFVTGIMIIFGGLGIILGIYTKLAVLLLVLFLAGTLYKVHAFWREEDPTKYAMEKVQFLKNLALLGACLMFLSILSPWSLSL
jgi:putative oxidoreductase